MALNYAAYEFRDDAHRKLADLNAWTKQVEEPALEPDLPIIDPHHHVWDDARGRYLMHELAEDTGSGHNIVATVFIEAGSMYRATRCWTPRSAKALPVSNRLGCRSRRGSSIRSYPVWRI